MLKNLKLSLASALFAVTAIGASQVSAESTLDLVQERGTLRMGVAPGDPWFVRDIASGEWSGFCTSYGAALAADLGVTFEPVEVTWGNAVDERFNA